MSIESREFVQLRSDQFAMAAHEAARHITGTCLDGAAPTTLREALADAAEDIHMKRETCLQCGERKDMPVVAHVCDDCRTWGKDGE